jgi:hypothetical protein
MNSGSLRSHTRAVGVSHRKAGRRRRASPARGWSRHSITPAGAMALEGMWSPLGASAVERSANVRRSQGSKARAPAGGQRWTLTSCTMPTAENPDGTLWIDIRHSVEVDSIRRWLSGLGVPVTALVADPACEVPVEEVAWGDLYPKMVPRNGPEPGVIVQPAEIPPHHTLLLAVNRMDGAPNDRELVVMLRLVRGPAPPCYGRVVTRARPQAKDLPLRPARPRRFRPAG